MSAKLIDIVQYLLKSVVAALALFLATPGCNLFKTSGAACSTDSNCTSGQVCCNGVCSPSCSDNGGINASVTLATDYVPGYEFDTVIMDIEDLERQMVVSVVTELVNPRTIGQFSGLTRSSHAMTLTLRLTGVTVATRTISFNSTSDITVPFVITRDCEGTSCTGNTTQCLGSRCVSTWCSDLNPGTCPHPACLIDGDCTATSTCSTGVCISGVCLQRRIDTQCKNNERCIPDAGCVAQIDECDTDTQCDDLAWCTQDQCVNHRCNTIRDDSRCTTTACDPAAKTANPTTGCVAPPCSSDTCIPRPCETATCVDGECQRTATCHDNEHCCSGVCAIDCNDPRPCATRTGGDVCRVAVGACDVPETCDGVSDACPPDIVQGPDYACRPASGLCDIAESCDGVSGVCPPNAQGTECRPAGTACDVAEVCTGQSSACPLNTFQPASHLCRTSTGDCDVAEYCTGLGPGCPADAFQPASFVCRPAAGICDVAEKCTGTSATCPADAFQPSTQECRASKGDCDPAEKCTGSGAACPADAYYDNTHTCRPLADQCDVAEVCPGTSPTCPADAYLADGSYCNDGGWDGAGDRCGKCTGGTCAGCTGECARCAGDEMGNYFCVGGCY